MEGVQKFDKLLRRNSNLYGGRAKIGQITHTNVLYVLENL
jgi:hypothetical protein